MFPLRPFLVAGTSDGHDRSRHQHQQQHNETIIHYVFAQILFSSRPGTPIMIRHTVWHQFDAVKYGPPPGVPIQFGLVILVVCSPAAYMRLCIVS